MRTPEEEEKAEQKKNGKIISIAYTEKIDKQRRCCQKHHKNTTVL